jgi:hypothetical protein
MVKVISVISWQSVLLVEELEYPEKTTYLPQVTDKITVALTEYVVPKEWKALLRNFILFCLVLLPVCIAHGVLSI